MTTIEKLAKKYGISETDILTDVVQYKNSKSAKKKAYKEIEKTFTDYLKEKGL